MAVITDLSKYQGDIDFCKLKGQVDFVILRVQAGYTTHDQKYKEYVAGCKANGIPFGTYAYFRGVSIPDSIAEAKCAMELTDPESKFSVVDIESNSMTDLVAGGQAFIDYLKNKGVQKVGLYSGENFYNKHNLGAIKCDFVWIANYGKNDGQQHNAPKVACDLWQYTSVGKLDGIAGNVDLNTLTGSKPLEYFTGVQAHSIPEPVHTAAAPLKVIGHVKVIATDLRMRKGPGTGFPVVGEAVTGKIYNVYAVSDQWHQIGPEQWVWGEGGKYLELITDAPVYYVIKSGDNLTNIAKNNGTTVSQLQAWNNIKDPDKIFAGQKIRIK